MSKFIIGSGLVGLMCRHILGPSWKLVPEYKSRFFSYPISLDDNFIIRNPKIDDIVLDKFGTKNRKPYRISYSYQGEILKSYDKNVSEIWHDKVFDGEYPAHSVAYYKDHMSFDVYDLRCNNIYTNLQELYKEEILAGVNAGLFGGVKDHSILIGNNRYDYSQIINTTPYDSFLTKSGYTHDLKSKDVHFVHISTTKLNFEGCNQLLVADHNLDFYKVTNIGPNNYLFYFNKDVVNPGIYLLPIVGEFDIEGGTCVPGYLPIGERLNHQIDGVINIGSYAQWDWCMDIGSCIMNIVKLL